MSDAEEKELEKKLYVRVCCIAVMCCLVVLAIVIPITVVLSGDATVVFTVPPTAAPSEAPSMATSATPTSEDFSILLSTIQDLHNDEYLFKDFDSPQYKAAQWAVSDATFDVPATGTRIIN